MDAVLIESHVTILQGVKIGAHSKICAGVTVDRDVEDWTIVYGNGEMRRRRRRPGNGAEADGVGQLEVVEAVRLKALDKEREGTVAILKTAARLASLARKK